MRPFRLLLVPLALLLTSLGVQAQDCSPTTSAPEGDLDIGPVRFYVDHEPGCQPDCCPCGIVWIYEESNGIDGLQRSDDDRDDTCGGRILADTLIF